MAGAERSGALRADAATAEIPVHFLSAMEGAERGLAMGAIGYLTKPATRQDLTRVVESLARGIPLLSRRNEESGTAAT